jgi:general L-amino acid transport system permease protein
MSDTATLADLSLAFVRREPVQALPPPEPVSGAAVWLRRNLLSTPLNVALTIVCALLIAWVVPPLLKFLVFDAVWQGTSRADCLVTPQRPEVGACWAFIIERVGFFTYGFYPVDQRWRVDVFFVLLAVGFGWMMWLDAPRRDLGLIYFFILMPAASIALLLGFSAIGLPAVPTAQWGGVLVTLVVSAVGIMASLPLGVLLALGRRSQLPAVRLAAVIFIEFVRGVPLISVLFMASVMLPLFVPEAWTPDKLLRALVGVVLFASAYMAEVVRAGLAAIPRGQYEAAMSVGLSYWQTMRLVVLPQALRITIPNIVNTYIGLFKDTTLVFVVGIFDFLRTVEAARIDPQWATPVTSTTGYAFAAIFYFVFCYAMARYARFVEARLAAPDRR